MVESFLWLYHPKLPFLHMHSPEPTTAMLKATCLSCFDYSIDTKGHLPSGVAAAPRGSCRIFGCCIPATCGSVVATVDGVVAVTTVFLAAAASSLSCLSGSLVSPRFSRSSSSAISFASLSALSLASFTCCGTA